MGRHRVRWKRRGLHRQAAIDAAGDGDTVLVKPGEYVITEPINFNRLHETDDPATACGRPSGLAGERPALGRFGYGFRRDGSPWKEDRDEQTA